MPAGAEVVFPAVALQLGGGRILPTPAQFYLTGEDRLRVVSVNALTGVTIGVHARTANSAGETKGHIFRHTPASDRTVRTEDFSVGDGSLLNVTAFAFAGAPLMGQTYVMVQLIRGAGSAGIVLGVILGGCVTSTQAIGFPGSPIASSLDSGGYLRHIIFDGVLNGVEYSATVPTGARWELQGFYGFLTADATAGNRQSEIVIDDGSRRYFVSPNPALVAPSTTGELCWAQGFPLTTAFAGFPGLAGLPQHFQLMAAHRLRTVTSGFAPGDRWSFVDIHVREWLECP